MTARTTGTPTSKRFEITVRFNVSEWEEINTNLPEPIAHTTETSFGESNEGTTIGTSTIPQLSSTTERSVGASRRVSIPKIVLYECEEYRIENGVLVMTDTIGKLGGYMVPLNSIQEIRIDHARGTKA